MPLIWSDAANGHATRAPVSGACDAIKDAGSFATFCQPITVSDG